MLGITRTSALAVKASIATKNAANADRRKPCAQLVVALWELKFLMFVGELQLFMMLNFSLNFQNGDLILQKPFPFFAAEPKKLAIA